MNLECKLNELTRLIQQFLDGSESLERLNDFVWDVIDYFSDSRSEELPPVFTSEREFWYAVWRVQHLVGEADDLLKEELPTILSYLRKEIQLPKECEGRRPVPSGKP
jgi:hypothetical protein